MKFGRQRRPATETSWVVSYGGKTISRWRTAAILKIDISLYLSEKSSDFDEILYTAQQQIKNWMNVTWPKMKKLHWTDCEFERTYFLFTYQVISVIITTLIIQHFFTLSLRAPNLPFQQILPVLILFRPCTAFTTTEPDRTYHASLFIFSSFFSLIFCLSRVVD